MTDPTENSSSGEVPGNAFSGPTGAQHGSSNTQVNHYAAPSTSPGGAGQVAVITTAALLVAGAIGLAAIKFTPVFDGHTPASQTSNPKASQTSNPKASQASKPTSSPTSQQSILPVNPPSTSPAPSTASPSPPLKPESGNITLVEDETLCLDVRGLKYERGATVQTYDCVHDMGQRWRWEGRYLRAYSGCLDPKHEGKEVGTPVILWDCTHREAQEWEWDTQGKLLNPHSGLCLGYPKELSGASIPLKLYDCANVSARVWYHWGKQG